MRYSQDDGKRFTYTQVNKALQKARGEQNRPLADVARKMFGDDLDLDPRVAKCFTYQKTGRTYVYRKDKEIAAVFERLLDAQPEIRARYDEMKAAGQI